MIDLIIIGFASYAVTFLVHKTDGPLDVFKRFREFVGFRWEESEIYPNEFEKIIDEDKFLAKLFGCFWCLCTWVSVALYLIYGIVPSIVTVLAVIGLTGFLEEVTK